MVRAFWEPFSAKVADGRTSIPKQIEITDIPCPISGEKGDRLVKRFGRNGWFLGCSGYPECKYTQALPGEEGATPAPDLAGVGEQCPTCGKGTLVARTGRYGPFVGCDRYPDCRHIVKQERPTERFGTCPKCGSGTVVTKHARRGRRPFWGCDRYPDCDYSSWTRPAPVEAEDAPAAAAAS